MKFANPIYFLLFVPTILIFVLYIFGKVGKEATIKYSNIGIIKSSGARRLSFSRVIPAALRLVGVGCLIFALARPQTGTGEEKTTKDIVDIIISLDVSGSMATLDFNPDNRLVAAKREAKGFVEARKNDRIGLVVFSGQSFTQCPLTTDHQAILTLLDSIQIGMADDGTAIGLGIANAVNRLKDSEAKSKVIILLTDGVNNAGMIDPLTAAGLAKELKIRVYTIGVGREGEFMLPVQDPRFGIRYINVKTEIDEKTLTKIAKETGGHYFRAQDSRSLRDIFREIDSLEKTKITVEQYTYYEEKYFLFLWPGLFILLFEMLWVNLIKVKIP